jgi:hypothetical protein
VVSWYGEFLTRADYRCIDDSSLTIHETLAQAGTGKDHQGLTFVDKRSESRSKGHFSKFDVAEIEEEQDRLHLIFFKKKLAGSVCSYVPFLGADRPNCFALNKDTASFLRDRSVLLSERYIIFQVLRI